MILKVFPSGPLQTNCYLLACSKTKRAVIIDAPFGTVQPVLEAKEQLGLHIEKILLTHSHWDHIADVAFLKEKLGIPVYVHAEDAPNVEHPGIDKLPFHLKIQPTTVDHFLSEPQEIHVGELAIHVIHTPGHTPGGVCFYLPGQAVVFSGDTLFRGAMGSLKLPTASVERMWPSLKKLSLLPPHTKVYPGHGGSTTIGEEKWLGHAKEYYN